jgi:thioredoxin 1
MAGTIAHVENKTFQLEVLKSTVPVLVDFWAEWCAPCRALAPTLEELNKELGGKVKFVKVNVDQSPDLAQQFNIRSIPTLLVFKDGAVVSQSVGNIGKADLKARLETHLA